MQYHEDLYLHVLVKSKHCQAAFSAAAATLAPVERVFSESELIMHAHRAHMTDQLLENLILFKCNSYL